MEWLTSSLKSKSSGFNLVENVSEVYGVRIYCPPCSRPIMSEDRKVSKSRSKLVLIRQQGFLAQG